MPTHRRSCLVLVLGLLACGPQVEAPLEEDPSGSARASAIEHEDEFLEGEVTLVVSEPWVPSSLEFDVGGVQGTLMLTTCADLDVASPCR